MADVTKSEGYKKAKALSEKIKAEKEAKEKEQEKMNESKALTTTDYSKYAGMGMKNITAEDVRPPMMFMVQGNVDKKELVDQKGKECPDGHYYIKSFKEVLKKVSGYVIWVRKDHFQARDDASDSDQRWDGSRMYRVIFVRKDTMTPIAITFKKSSLSALNDLFTVSKVKNLPIFLFETEIEAVSTTNKKGQTYFKSVVNVIGPEKDTKILDKLFVMAQGFDGQEEVETEEDPEDITPQTVEDSGLMDEPTEEELNNSDDDVSDDIPF